MSKRRRTRLVAALAGSLALGWICALRLRSNSLPLSGLAPGANSPAPPIGVSKALGEARRLLDDGQTKDAAVPLAKAMSLSPSPLEIVAIARLSARAGDPRRAQNELEKVVASQRSHPDPDIVEAAAGAYLDLGQPVKARDLLEALTAQSRCGPQVWVTLARARAALGERAGAVEALRRAESLKPDDAQRRAISLAYQDAGAYGQADRVLAALSLAHVDDAQLLGDRGVLAALSGRSEQAAAYLARAIALSPSSAGPYLTLAVVYEQQNRKAKALKVLDAALSRPDLGPLRADVMKARRELLKKPS